jgi:hypothetical protein
MLRRKRRRRRGTTTSLRILRRTMSKNIFDSAVMLACESFAE